MIRKIFKLTLLTTFAIIVHNYLWHNLFYSSIEILLKTALILALFQIILKPILKILLLPINLITLGFIGMVVDTLGLYMAVYFLNGFLVNNFFIPAISWQGIVIPQILLNNFFAYLATSFSLRIIIYLFNIILYKNPKI
jgi:putative membrane protein